MCLNTVLIVTANSTFCSNERLVTHVTQFHQTYFILMSCNEFIMSDPYYAQHNMFLFPSFFFKIWQHYICLALSYDGRSSSFHSGRMCPINHTTCLYHCPLFWSWWSFIFESFFRTGIHILSIISCPTVICSSLLGNFLIMSRGSVQNCRK